MFTLVARLMRYAARTLISVVLGVSYPGAACAKASQSGESKKAGSNSAQLKQPPSSHVAAGKPAKPKADAPEPKYLLRGWNKGLAQKGVALTLKYEGDLAAAVSGGKRRGTDYAQQVELNVDADWQKIAGIKGLTSTVTFVNRAGKNVSQRIGDQLLQVQPMYGGTNHAAVHLVQAFADWKSDNDRIDVAAGRLPVGNDFGTSPYYCEFMDTALCGYPHSLPAKRGFTAFPNSTWGARLRVASGSRLYAQGGVYQVRPKYGGKYGLDWGWSGTTGTYFPLEVGWQPSFGPDELNGHYKLGFTTDTSPYKDNLYDVNGVPYPMSGRPPATHRGRHSFYLLGDQMLQRNGSGPENGLVVLGGFVGSDRETSKISRFAFAAVRDQGLIPGRTDDVAGVMVAHAHISNKLATAQRLLGDPMQNAEWVVEGTYRIAVTNGLTVSPDVQYFVHPNAEKSIPNALTVGTRLEVNF
ncbi:MAG TPA: carbohydrate porin [Sphingomicrobium sp.]|nr:carbohydrate porin [Sphingomicrobium sp.]